MELNKIMDFDHVVRVHADGSVTDEPDVWAPEVTEDGHIDARPVNGREWQLMYGYTGQYGQAHSPIMHPSEYIGGNLERDIRATPGLYVAVVVYGDVDAEDGEPGCVTEDVGWAVAYIPDES